MAAEIMVVDLYDQDGKRITSGGVAASDPITPIDLGVVDAAPGQFLQIASVNPETGAPTSYRAITLVKG